MPHSNGSPVGSVDRALRILTEISGASRGLSLDDLSGRLEVPKSSLHGLLAALKYRRFVTQPEPGGPYLLGTEMLATSFRFCDTLDLRTLVHPYLAQLARQLNETVHMAVLDGPEVVYHDKIESSHSIKLSSVIGGRNPAHATGVGKALLAGTYPTDEAIRAWAAQWGPLVARTPRTITSRENSPASSQRSGGRGTRWTSRRTRPAFAAPQCRSSSAMPSRRLPSAPPCWGPRPA